MNLHETVMGQRLILGTLPDIAHQLQRIADSLEKLTESKSVSANLVETLQLKVSSDNGYSINSKGNRGEGTAQSVLDYVERGGSVTHKEMQEYYKSLNGSNTFAYCLKNLLIPYKNRNTKRYLIKNNIGKYEVRLANPSNWVVKEY